MLQYRHFLDAIGQGPHFTEHSLSDDHPVVNVSWHDAFSYAQWAGVSLPSEAQWEKAARGNDGRIFPWGNRWDEGRCRWQIPQYGYIQPPATVGSYPREASPYAVEDMVGNIWEWCSDWYGEDSYKIGFERNPVGPESGSRRVTRGCGWSDDIQYPVNFSCYARYNQDPHFNYKCYGFRCVSALS